MLSWPDTVRWVSRPKKSWAKSTSPYYGQTLDALAEHYGLPHMDTGLLYRAVALSLFVGGAATELQTFTMLSGSRLGASFVVLLVGFLYALRNRGPNRRESIGMGVLALSLTAVVYVPGMAIGYGILKESMP